jgi:putative two-component system response regulator
MKDARITESSSSERNRPPARILVVDGDDAIRRLLTRYLALLGYEVETAGSMEEAVELLRPDRFDLVLTDLRLPVRSGLDLLVEVRKLAPGTRMILMTADADMRSASAAIDRGVDHLLVKPFELESLRVRLSESIGRRTAEREAESDRERARQAESRLWVLRAAHALAAAVEAKDEYTAGHATRVTTYGLTIAETMGSIDPDRFRLAGDLHDVGKIGVPDVVLNKAGRLTEEEMALVRKHPVTGAHILQPLIDDPVVLGVVRSHHERWDGQGYPDGLRGEEIPLEARVLAVADALDAMTSHRAYRRGVTWSDVLAEIRRCGGAQFDPGVVGAFEATLSRLHERYVEFSDSFPQGPALVA